MTASSSKGVTVDLVTGGATGTAVTPTAATKAKPSEITASSAPTGVVDGDLAVLASDSTGLSEIDGHGWIVDQLSGSNFNLLGSDTTDSADTFSPGEDIIVYGAADFSRMCFSELTFNTEGPESVSAGTYCDPTAQIVSAASQAGTLDFAGYIDITDPAYSELLQAKKDGEMRYLRITLPNNGYIVVPITISLISFDIPIDGVLGYSGSAIMNTEPQHLF